MVNLFDEFFSGQARWLHRAGRFLVVYLAAMLLAGFVAPLAHADRVKDLASLASMRSNQLLGYGLVVGLEGTGDGADLSVTASSMKAMLTRLGVNVEGSLGDFDTAAGGKMVLMYRWDAGLALQLIERERVSSVSGVPVMARELVTHPDFGKYDTSSLLSVGGGGAQIQPDLVDKIEKTVATARPNTGYGMTETCGIITSISGDFFVDKPASCGRAMPSFEAKVVDDAGNALLPGETGELWVRGASVIKGYINRPEATAESITDGWLHTGDVARIDEDGFIFLVDRKKDMVLRGGENVYCAEVEATLHQHPAIAECCVFGVPDARLGEEVAAAIVLRPGESVSAEALRAHCIGLAAKHKAPRYIWLLDRPLPRNASGKFLKRELREQLKLEDAA